MRWARRRGSIVHVLSTTRLELISARPEAAERHDTLVDGRRVHSLVAGAGRPVVLLHGLLGLAAGWTQVMSFLAEDARVYAPDALGMGQSERVRGAESSLRALAARLRAWMDAEGLETVDLVGTSHGGAVAMRFAADYPERVRSLVLHAPANPFCMGTRPQIRFFASRFGGRVARWLPFAPSALHRAALVRMYGDISRVRLGSLEEYVTSLRIAGTVDYVLDILRRWVPDMSALQPDLAKLRRVRTLLLWGDMDRAVTHGSLQAMRHVLRAPLKVLPGLGHLAFEEAPEQFAAEVAAFLAMDPVRLSQQTA